MSSSKLLAFEASADEQKLIVGPQGKTILGLTKRFNVRIDLPKAGSSTITVHGEQCQPAVDAIKVLLESKQPVQGIHSASSPDGLETPLSSLPLRELQSSAYHYMKYKLKTNTSKFDDKSVKSWINELLESLYGAVGGGSVDVDVLLVNIEETSFVVRTAKTEVIGVQAALALAQDYDNKPCAPLLVASSASLTALAAPSRLPGFAAFSMESDDS